MDGIMKTMNVAAMHCYGQGGHVNEEQVRRKKQRRKPRKVSARFSKF
jgi:hypothetical protein